jgi:hypothetical protein
MILVPDNYESLNLTSIQKLIISMLRKNLSDDYYLFIEVNPTGILNIPFVLIHKAYGILCITIDEANVPKIDDYLKVVKNMVWDKQEFILNSKIQREKSLIINTNKLKISLSWIYLFPNMIKQESENNALFLEEKCVFKNEIFSTFNDEEIILNLFAHNSRGKEPSITNEEFNTLGFIIAPHYYIPQTVSIIEKGNDEAIIIKEEIIKLDYKQREVKALSLDMEQINIINQFNNGDQLLLACAGSGKSALLIAKAFKLASTYPEKKVLITCFNSNLANYYQWRIDVAGFSNRNVECRTFHSLLQHLLANNEIKNPYIHSSESYFDDTFKLVISYFNKGKILPKYDAIFIDEVQIFKKEWYMLCYNLLNSKEKEKHLFVIAGDKSQNVNNNIQKGLAPWQIELEGYPTYETNTIRIETNYRNSKEINDYINNFVTIVKGKFEKIGFDISKRDDLFLRGNSKRHGNKPVIQVSNRYNEVKQVFENIDKLHYEYNIPLSEIVILIPQRKYGAKRVNYFILEWLKDEFNRRYMDYTPLLNDDDDYTRYGDRKGVSICTIESALGLDFEAVIICGLFPLGFYSKSYKEEHLIDRTVGLEELEPRKENFFKNINQLYTGMTRARNYLYIVLSHDDKNIYSDILLSSEGGGDIC